MFELKNEYVNKVHGLNNKTSSFGDNSNQVIRFPNEKLKRNSIVFKINGIKKHKTFIKFVKDRLGHDYRYAINSNLIKKEIGWKAKIDFTNGILRTVNWYLENQNWWKKLINKV